MLNGYSTPKFLAVDFFCGAGGTTRGLLDAGGYVIAGIDKEESCRTTYRLNNRNMKLDRTMPHFLNKDMSPATPDHPEGQQAEIRENLATWIPYYRSMASEAPLLFAICAPCQSHNRYPQPNITKERTASRELEKSLLSQSVSLLEEFEPDMVLSENVAGIANGKHGHVWKDFIDSLRQLGYRVGTGEVCASKFGIAQRRRRSIIMAIKSHDPAMVENSLPVPSKDRDAPERTVYREIGHLPPLQAGEKHANIPNHHCRNLAEINRLRLLSVEPGEPNSGFPDELALPCHRRMAEGGKRGFGDVYTRVHPHRPAPTITTRFHSISNGRFGHYDTNQARGLSLKEGALLQSFPQHYKFYGDGMESIARMIGNAVPPRLAKHLAMSLSQIWKHERSASMTPGTVG